MKIIVPAVTDDDIRHDVEYWVTEFKAEGWILFPDDDACNELVDECVREIVDRYELYERAPNSYCPNYDEIIFDCARDGGYIVDDSE